MRDQKSWQICANLSWISNKGGQKIPLSLRILSMEKISALSKLSHICAGFFKDQSWQDLIQQIIDAGLEATQADRGTVFLIPNFDDPSQAHTLSSIIATGVNGRVLNISDKKGIAGYVFRKQVPVLIDNVQNDPRFCSDIDKKVEYETKSLLCVPLRIPWGKGIGCIELLNKKNGTFTQQDLEISQILALFASLALEQRYTIQELESRNKALLDEKNSRYDQISSSHFLESNSPHLRHIFKQLPTYAESDSSVLVQGESGTGKELIARYLHQNSPRSSGPFVAVNCSAIPEELFEAELFGVTEGAATGTRARRGKIEMAAHGTLFLDEIGEMPVAMQSKLLRVLQDKMVTPLGSDTAPKYVDFRIISATNRDLAQMMKDQTFREDLYYRLSVLNVQLLPLRERREDLEAICETIFTHFARSRGWKPKTLSPPALKKLQNYPWPGNIRELQNRLENAYIVSKDRLELQVEDISLPQPGAHLSVVSGGADRADQESDEFAPVLTLKEAKDRAERDSIVRALKASQGNKVEAGKLLGVSREGLRKAMKKHKVA